MEQNDVVGTREPKSVFGFIPNERMGDFYRKIDIIQAQARKLDLPEWVVSIGEKEWRPVKVIIMRDHGQSAQQTMQLEGRPVSIVGDAPVLAQWRFLAKIEHGDGGNLVKRMAGSNLSPAAWHTCAPLCDHCDVVRTRNNTYFLENVDSKELKQVGSSCLGDFLGAQYRDPDRILAMYDFLMDIKLSFEDDSDREFDGPALESLGVPPLFLMAAVLQIIQEDKSYLSVDKAEALNCLSTGDRLRAAFFCKSPILVTPDEAAIALAPQVLAWLQSQKEATSLWLRNIAYLSDRPAIRSKDAGLFASGYVAWGRELQRQLKLDKGLGDWLGVEGVKISVAATLDWQGGFDTAFGFKTLLSFRDEDGNNLMWKTQSPPGELVIGSTYRLFGTVKSHSIFRDEKQTEIIRVKVAELELFTRGSMPAFKKLASMAKPDVHDRSGHTPLMKAVWDNAIDYAKVLVAAGADVNQWNQGEIPILAYAASIPMARLLLGAGARAEDVSAEYLKELVPDVRSLLLDAMA